MKQWIVNLNDILAQKEAAEREKAKAPPRPPEPPIPPEEEPLEPQAEKAAVRTPAPPPVEPSSPMAPPPPEQQPTPQEAPPIPEEKAEEAPAPETTVSPATPPPEKEEPPEEKNTVPEEEVPAPEAPSPAEPTTSQQKDDPDLDAPLPDPEEEAPEEEEELEIEAPPKPPFWSRWKAPRIEVKKFRFHPVLLCILVAVLGIFALLHQQGQLDRLIRWYHYSNVAGDISFPHNVQRVGVFVGHGRNLIVCTETQLQVFSPTGDVHLNETMNMSTPAVNTAKNSFVAYDAGGHELRVVKENKVVFSLTLETGKTILSATLNDAGWLAVTTKEDGYKGVITIYTPTGEYREKMAIRLSSRYLTDAIISPDCSGVYAVSPGQSNGAFESSLLYFTIPNPTTDTPIAQVSLGNSIVLNTRCTGKTCWVLGENLLYYLSSKGSLENQYDYQGRYLKKGSLEGDGFAALLLSNSQSSSSGTLVTVDRNGEEIATLDITEPVTSMVANGKYVALLTASHLYLYNKELEQLSESDEVLGFSSIVLFADGSMNLISEKNADLYLP